MVVSMYLDYEFYSLKVVHQLRHLRGGYGGVSQKMTQDDTGVRGGLEGSEKR